MTFRLRLHPLLSGALAAAACTAAVAQQTQPPASPQPPASRGTERQSVLPYTHDGYLGISGGRSKYDLGSGPAGVAYDNSGSAMKLVTGGFFHPNFGVELGYIHAGKAQRLGGDTKAHGFNLSLVGRAPLNEQFDVFGKIGTTYGRTQTSGSSGLGVATGKEDGFGLSYGIGARWAFTPQWAAVVEWESHQFKFADGDNAVKMTTVGLQYRF